MWIRYIGEKPYNSMKVRDFKPKERRNLDSDLAKHLLEKYPNWFKQTKPPVKEVLGIIKETPKVIKEAFKGKLAEKDKDKKVKGDIDIEVTEEVKKK